MAQEFGSLFNMLDSRTRFPMKPYVGMGATQLCWSDRHAFTVVDVSPSGKTIQLQQDNARRTDKNGMSESQRYTFEPNPGATVVTARLTRTGKWKASGQTFAIGWRDEYYDYSF